MKLQIIFDGPALKNHEIDIQELSPALLGINQLIKEANQILNGEKTKINVKVRGSFKEGSFQIDLFVIQSVWEQAKQFLLSDDVTAILAAKEIIILVFGIGGAGIVSLIRLLKFLKGKRPTKITEDEAEKGLSIVFLDEKQLKVKKEVLELYRSYKIRKAFEQSVDPVSKEGIDSLAFTTDNKNYQVIKKEEYSYFQVPTEKEKRIDDQTTVFETKLNLINISFEGNRKWYVNDGVYNFYVQVEDEVFLKKIDLGRSEFGKYDLLKVRIRKEQFLKSDSKKLKTYYYIEEVLDHMKISNGQNDLFDGSF